MRRWVWLIKIHLQSRGWNLCAPQAVLQECELPERSVQVLGLVRVTCRTSGLSCSPFLNLGELWGLCSRALCQYLSKQSLQQHHKGESHSQPTVLMMLKGH